VTVISLSNIYASTKATNMSFLSVICKNNIYMLQLPYLLTPSL